MANEQSKDLNGFLKASKEVTEVFGESFMRTKKQKIAERAMTQKGTLPVRFRREMKAVNAKDEAFFELSKKEQKEHASERPPKAIEKIIMRKKREKKK